MKVLLAHNFFNPIGGAEVFYHEVGRVLAEKGHEVAYFSPKEPNIDSPWEKYFPTAIDFKNNSLGKNILNYNKIIYSTEAKNKLKQLIRDFKPDIVHVFAIYVRLTPAILDACTEEGIPVVMSCNDYKHICPNYKLYHHGHICEECKGGKFYRAVVNKCCHDSYSYSVTSSIEAYVHNTLKIYQKNVHTFLFASEFMAHKTEEFWGKETFRWKKLRNPFDSIKYKVDSFTKSSKGPVLFFGRLIEEKGVDLLIQAASMLPDITFRIIGDGPDMASLKQLADDLKLTNVAFVGAKWGDELNDELEACRFVVIPSLWNENFPYVINQSFALGKPVIGSNKGGIPELVQHGERGLVFDASSISSLVAAIDELWNDAKKVSTMSQNAKIYSDSEFNDENFYQTLEDIYSGVLS